MNLFRQLYVFVPLMLAVCAFAAPSQARPWVTDKTQEIRRWQPGSVITVYVPADPPQRYDAVKAGVELWNDDPSLKKAGISVVVRPHPGGEIRGAVEVKFRSDLGTPGSAAITSRPGPVISAGSITIETDQKGVPVGLDKIKFVSAHEMGHILGLDDTKDKGTNSNELMYYLFNAAKLPLTKIPDADSEQVKSIYFAGETKIGFKSEVIPEGSLYRYLYEAEWLEGPQLAYFAVSGSLSDIVSATPPDGWEFSDFSLAEDLSVKFRGFDEPPFVAFRIARADSYLGPANPLLNFEFLSMRAPTAARAYLNGPFVTIGPAIVPEPMTWAMFVAGFGAIGALARGSRRRPWGPARST
jgi:hypothetical protein